MMAHARTLLKFSCDLYAMQHAAGRVFLHEHPATAGSWKEAPILELLKLNGVIRRDLDMCQYNLTCKNENGETLLVQKHTTIMTNSLVMGEFLARRCCGGHRHAHLWGGSRCAQAAIYTAEFAEAIVEGYKMHVAKTKTSPRKHQQSSLKARECMDSSLHYIELDQDDPEDCPTLDELFDIYVRLPESKDGRCWDRPPGGTNETDTSGCREHPACGENPEDLGNNINYRMVAAVEKETEMVNSETHMAWDDVKDQPLDPKQVADARKVELAYVAKHKVYSYAPVAECWEKTGAAPIGTRWLDTNKGDSTNPCFRSRWVAQQYRRAWVETLFAATPQIEAARLLIADATSRCKTQEAPQQEIRTMVVDIRRAYFYAKAQRPLYIKLPQEDPKSADPNLCGKLEQSLYGTRDAGANWHAEYSRFLLDNDLLQGTTNPCHFYSADFTIKIIVHGDDFLCTGTPEKMSWLRQRFEDKYDCKVEEAGFGKGVGRSVRFLNRVITYNEDSIEFESDQRLVESLIHDLNLEKSNTSPAPGSKPKPIKRAEHQAMVERRLSGEHGGECIIANLRAEIGQLKQELAQLRGESSPMAPSSPEEVNKGAPTAPGNLNEDCTNIRTHKGAGELYHTDVEEDGADEEEGACAEEEGERLEGERLKNYQKQAARANYLCLDRPDIGYATKESMRRLSAPTEGDEVALKKIGRYLLGNPRLISVFKYGKPCATLTVEGDSDHAGCIRTRKSTSGGVIRWGSYVLKWWSKTQPTLALSSGEAELAAIVRSTSEGLGMKAMMEEFGIKVDLVVKSDAVAAIGIVKRQGLGRVRHLAVADLWVQQKAKGGEVQYMKLEGRLNTSDMLTKAVERDTLMRHIQALGMVFRAGRNSATPEFNGGGDGIPHVEEDLS